MRRPTRLPNSVNTRCFIGINKLPPPQRVAAAVVYRRDSWRWDVLNRATHTNNLPLNKETEKVGLGQILLVLLASIFI